MNYSIMIAAAFILATIAVATMSPFEHLPQSAPDTAASAPASSDSASDDSSDDTSNMAGSNASSNIRGHWEAGEAPPQ